MDNRIPKRVDWRTGNGSVVIQSHCTPAFFENLTLKIAFRGYACYNPIVSGKEELMELAGQPGANVTVAHNDSGDIVGLAVLRYPDPDERWHRVGEKVMMEVGAVEVSQQWRSMGISTQMLRCLMEHPLEAEKIMYMVGYSWIWDLDCSGLLPMEYRQMMINLFSKEGFKTYQTNEPNVMLRPENLFMARIGSRVPEAVVDKFKLVRFNMDMP